MMSSDSSSSSVQGARDKGSSGKFYDFDGNTRRIGTLAVTKTAADADFHDIQIRRERAYQWHARWAMPNYDQMKKNVIKAGAGLDSEYSSRSARNLVVLHNEE